MNSDLTIPHATGIVLAGGKSERMGHNKALIQFRGKPLIWHALEKLRPICTELFIIANDPGPYEGLQAPVLPDVIPDRGSLGGIYTGLVNAGEPYAIAVACDMPFLNHELLRYELSLAPDADVIVPRVEYVSPNGPQAGKSKTAEDMRRANLEELHPMHAVYSKSCVPVMRQRIEAGDLRARSFFDRVRIRVVEPAEVERFDPLHISVFNVNTVQDLQAAEELANRAGQL